MHLSSFDSIICCMSIFFWGNLLNALKFGSGLRSQFGRRGAVSEMNQKPTGKSPETRGNGRCVASRFRFFWFFFRRQFQAQIPAHFFILPRPFFFHASTQFICDFLSKFKYKILKNTHLGCEVLETLDAGVMHCILDAGVIMWKCWGEP